MVSTIHREKIIIIFPISRNTDLLGASESLNLSIQQFKEIYLDWSDGLSFILRENIIPIIDIEKHLGKNSEKLYLFNKWEDTLFLWHFFRQCVLWAAQHGNLTLMKKFKRVNMDLHFGGNIWHEHPLRVAAQYGQLEMVRYLIEEEKADFFWNKIIITEPFIHGQLPILDYIIKTYNFSNEKLRNRGEVYMRWAGEGGSIEVIQYLQSCGLNGEEYETIALKAAIQSDHLPLVKYLISSLGQLYFTKYPYTEYLFYSGFSKPHFEIVKFLLTFGIQMDDSWIYRILSSSLLWGNLEGIKYLLNRIANAAPVIRKDCKALLNRSGFEKALASGNVSLAKLIFQKCTNRKFLYLPKFFSQAVYSESKNRIRMLQFLIEDLGMDPNLQVQVPTKNYPQKYQQLSAGFSALNESASQGYLDVLQLLVGHYKMNINEVKIYRKQKFTILNRAVSMNHLDTVQYLVEQGANEHTYSKSLMKELAKGSIRKQYWQQHTTRDTLKYLIQNGGIVNFDYKFLVYGGEESSNGNWIKEVYEDRPYSHMFREDGELLSLCIKHGARFPPEIDSLMCAVTIRNSTNFIMAFKSSTRKDD
jgi:ankyrin repeat protein